MAAEAFAGTEGKSSYGSPLELPWEQDFHTTSEQRFVYIMEVTSLILETGPSHVTLDQKAPCQTPSC